jgi:predicted RecA/RadA family phage recombinase
MGLGVICATLAWCGGCASQRADASVRRNSELHAEGTVAMSRWACDSVARGETVQWDAEMHEMYAVGTRVSVVWLCHHWEMREEAAESQVAILTWHAKQLRRAGMSPRAVQETLRRARFVMKDSPLPRAGVDRCVDADGDSVSDWLEGELRHQAAMERLILGE